MAIYSIFTRDGDPAPQAVGDRFSWFPALLPPVHALVHGLWLGLVAWIAGTVSIVALGFVIGSEAAFWLYVLFAILYGFEAASLRRVALGRRGHAYRGERLAAREEEAELAWLTHRP